MKNVILYYILFLKDQHHFNRSTVISGLDFSLFSETGIRVFHCFLAFITCVEA